MYLEYVVVGVPISNQSTGSPALQAWRAAVKHAVKNAWTGTPLVASLKVVIINFHTGKPSLDLDNMAKPIWDVMQQIVYDNDRQISQAELAHVRIDAPFVVVGASKLIVAAVQAGTSLFT